FCIHSLKKLSLYYISHSLTFLILQSSSSLSLSLNIIIIQDFYLFFYSTLSICLSITLYTFLTMILCFHNTHYHSAHIRQFISESSHIDRFTFTNNSELNIELLIKNLKNMIIKKLSVSCVTESSMSLSVSSVTSFSAALSQSSTSVSVSDSPASATSVPATLTSATSDFIISAFIISSP
ncbi:hypothetical protein BDBG_16787, partial [Blastomyces gilchristii SLH14081]